MANCNIALVVPTIRENSFKEFLKSWEETNLFDRSDLIVMEDNPNKTFEVPPWATHLCWEDIDKHAWGSRIIPRRSDCVRSFAYWYAAQKGYDYIMTLDDDCYPHHPMKTGITEQHVSALQPRTKWFNTLSKGRPRGIPYKNQGKREVAINHGLWSNVLDLDSLTQLVAPFWDSHGEVNGEIDSQVVPSGSYFPMCGMNLCWRSEYTVLMYHLLMGSMMLHHSSLPNDYKLIKLPYDRFGDIWCGIIAKKLLDSRDILVSTGKPLIRHDKASDPFVNLVKEAPGIKTNEIFWEIINSFSPSRGETLAQDYYYLGSFIKTNARAFKDNEDYFVVFGESMMEWSILFGAKR